MGRHAAVDEDVCQPLFAGRERRTSAFRSKQALSRRSGQRLANLVPPPRKHRHRYHGVFAPNHEPRPAVTTLAIGNIGKRREATAERQVADLAAELSDRFGPLPDEARRLLDFAKLRCRAIDLGIDSITPRSADGSTRLTNSDWVERRRLTGLAF